jgi:septal ring factor EnvC (AmiA/AmiB activator)
MRLFLRISALALLITTASFGQSLGDVARENREKKVQDASTPPPKVITNQNLPKDPDATAASPEASQAASSDDDGVAVEHRSSSSEQTLAEQRLAQRAQQRSAQQRSAQQRSAQQRAAEQWKRQIVAQKNKMAALQARIDQIQASIQSANGSVQYEGPTSRYQAQQLDRVAQIQQQLGEQKRILEQMQEAARHAGMHTVVYDP